MYLQDKLAPKHRLAYLNFLHFQISHCVQPSLTWYVITAFPLALLWEAKRNIGAQMSLVEVGGALAPLWVSVGAYLFSHRSRRSGWGCWDDSHSSGVVLPWEGSNSGGRGTGEKTRSSCLHRHSAGPRSGSHSLREKQSLVSLGLFHKLAIAEFSSLALTQNMNQKLEVSLSKS